MSLTDIPPNAVLVGQMADVDEVSAIAQFPGFSISPY